MVHRDLKPSNILVDAAGRVKLLDFGIAKLLAEERRSAPPRRAPLLRAMTPEYAAPEQVRGDSVTTATDVYSLGVLLYELLTGARPYRVAAAPEGSWSGRSSSRSRCGRALAPPGSAATWTGSS